MPAARFFFPKPFTLGGEVVLEGQESSHLSRVTRKGPGDVVELVNGLGELAKGEVLRTEKQTATLLIKAVEKTPLQKPLLIVAQALPHLQKLDLVVEKGTELGCDLFWFFEGDLSDKKGLTPQQKIRLQTIAEAALKQCGRLFLPKIELFPSLEEVLKMDATFFYGDPNAPWIEAQGAPPFCFVVGPESGFSKRELKLLEKKATGAKLHTNILRTETATISALSLLSYLHASSSS